MGFINALFQSPACTDLFLSLKIHLFVLPTVCLPTHTALHTYTGAVSFFFYTADVTNTQKQAGDALVPPAGRDPPIASRQNIFIYIVILLLSETIKRHPAGWLPSCSPLKRKMQAALSQCAYVLNRKQSVRVGNEVT